jgi:hypothetical protein
VLGHVGKMVLMEHRDIHGKQAKIGIFNINEVQQLNE